MGTNTVNTILTATLSFACIALSVILLAMPAPVYCGLH
jgi:hypothetical protein